MDQIEQIEKSVKTAEALADSGQDVIKKLLSLIHLLVTCIKSRDITIAALKQKLGER